MTVLMATRALALVFLLTACESSHREAEPGNPLAEIVGHEVVQVNDRCFLVFYAPFGGYAKGNAIAVQPVECPR